jgi:hypothetical protein
MNCRVKQAALSSSRSTVPAGSADRSSRNRTNTRNAEKARIFAQKER